MKVNASDDLENDAAQSDHTPVEHSDKSHAPWFEILLVALFEALPLVLAATKSRWKSPAGEAALGIPQPPSLLHAETQAQAHTPEYQLSQADSRIVPGNWLPPRGGILPHVRVLDRWINVLWALPIGIVFLVIGITIAQGLRDIPAVRQFITAYPGQVSIPVYSGYPAWLCWQHFFNFFLLFFIIRSGVQILADHPRLYWNRNSTPGTEWFRFQHEVPMDRVWTSKDDSVTLPGWLGIPGVRHSVGLARKWHFSNDLFWLINGIIFYVMLFTTDQWKRLVPLSWSVFPNAVSTGIQYFSLTFPSNQGWTYFNGLQQITYFITVFIAAPAAVGTGLMQSPAISNKLGWIGRLVNRQVARTVHFTVLCWFIFFVVIHVTMIFITGLFLNLNHMFAGINSDSPLGFGIFCGAALVVIVTWFLASPMTVRYARFVQNAGDQTAGALKAFAELWKPTNRYSQNQIAPFFWPNGTMPTSAYYEEMAKSNFANYSLRVDGLVENPMVFSLDQLKSMPKQEQITEHFCIQGWSGIAKWGGVSMGYILNIVKPTSGALYAVFYSLAPGSDGGLYYDVHGMRNMRHPMTILAYEMNGKPVSVLHGAPLRLRVENELGFKMMKWIGAIEFVHDFHHLGAGKGGYNEDHEFYGNRDPI